MNSESQFENRLLKQRKQSQVFHANQFQ